MDKRNPNLKQNALTPRVVGASTQITHGDSYRVFTSAVVGTTTFTLPQALAGSGPFYFAQQGATSLLSIVPASGDKILGGTSSYGTEGAYTFYGFYCNTAGNWLLINSNASLQSPVFIYNSSEQPGFQLFVNPTLTTGIVAGNWAGVAGGQAAAAIDIGNIGIMSYPNTGAQEGINLYVIANGYYDGANYRSKVTGSVTSLDLLAVSGTLEYWESTSASVTAGSAATLGLVWRMTGGNATEPELLSGVANATTFIGTNFTSTDTGKLWIQAGSGSTSYGGAIGLAAGSNTTVVSGASGTGGGVYIGMGTVGTGTISFGLGGDPAGGTLLSYIARNGTYTGTMTGSGGAAFLVNSGSLNNSLVLNSSGSDWGVIANTGTQIWSLGASTTQNGAMSVTSLSWGQSAGSPQLGFFGTAPVLRITGYGTPTGGSHQGSFAAGSITLANLAAAVAQLIIDLKSYGLVAA